MKKAAINLCLALWVACFFHIESTERIQPNSWQTDLKLVENEYLNSPVCDYLFLFGVTRIFLNNEGYRAAKKEGYVALEIGVGIPEGIKKQLNESRQH